MEIAQSGKVLGVTGANHSVDSKDCSNANDYSLIPHNILCLFSLSLPKFWIGYCYQMLLRICCPPKSIQFMHF